MKSFDFKLKTVLEVRVNEEVRASEVHSEAKSFLEEALSQYQAVEVAIESNLIACEQAFEGQVASGTLSHLQTALRELRQQLEDLEPMVAERQSLVDTSCKELLQARQRREALEKMRDRQQDEFEQDLVRSEQQAMDEMVLLREAGGYRQRL